MKFIIQVIDTATGTGSDAEMAEITAFNNSLREAGKFVMAAGIQSPKESTLIDNRKGAGEVSAGPLHDLEEYVSGFWIIEASDELEAKEIALGASQACNRKVELRPFII